METKVVKTSMGDIRCREYENRLEFRGIKYATAGRWQYPKVIEKWDGVLDATEYGPCCPQERAFTVDAETAPFFYKEFRENQTFTYSEDCLNLNIVTPKDAKNCPVLIYTFGGGFVIVTFMKRKFVDELHWIDEREMLDMTALAQSSPGAIAVNAAILVGWKVGGFAGMAAAVLGTVIPPVVILSVISLFYNLFAENRYVALVLKGMSCGVAAVILDVSISLGKNVLKAGQWAHYAVMAAAFVATFFFRVNVVWIILAAAAVGVVLALYSRKGAEQA